MVALLAVEPVVVLALLFNDGTHDLVRYYPKDALGEELPVVGSGPVFWVHLVYSNAMILVASVLFVASMVRLSRTYRQMAFLLLAAGVLPWAANLLHNFEVGWFARIDLTPFAFTLTGAVLVWGLWRERLVRLAPLARDVMVDNMSDGVFLVDAFGRIADVNPSGARALGSDRASLVGRPLADLLERTSSPGQPDGPTGIDEPSADPALWTSADQRSYDVQSQELSDRRGRPAGQLVVLRDMTDRVRIEQRLQHLLEERSRVAAALQTSLTPASLPDIEGIELASRYEPAGDGGEIGGDFLDAFPLGPDTWGLFLGDVSGKGAEAAAVTAFARYTLRTLAHAEQRPSRTLWELNARLSAAVTGEMHCTLVYAVAHRCAEGLEVTLSLAGHHPPLVRRGDGPTLPAGAYGTALGLIDDPDLFDETVVLGPNDVLCMFTDGLVEARDGTELFGSERAAAVIDESAGRRTDDIAAALVAAARDFHHSDELADDLAILVLRVDAFRQGGSSSS
jgi:serine phosphatase RsbU (regulator of sigma subunit)